MFHLPGGWEWIAILVIALLLFGNRLPDVARGMGKSIVEFKKGLKGIQDGMNEVERDIDNEVAKSEQADRTKQLEAKSDATPTATPGKSTATSDQAHTV
jgi:sec-independent protein translocase protein TatA